MTQLLGFDRLEAPRIALRVGLGLAALLAGLDKFVGLLADWPAYLAPPVAALLPMSPELFMAAIGIVEAGVGLAILWRWPREGALVAAVWLLLVAGNLVLAGFFDVAVRDVAMAIAAFALARLSEVHEAAAASAPALGPARVEAAA